MAAGTAGDRDALIKRLAALKALAGRGCRPGDKPFGRWLGDFLDQDTDHGLRDAEFELLRLCRNGKDVNKQSGDLSHTESTEVDRAETAKLLRATPLKDRKEILRRKGAENRIRAGFLRFLILGGDKFAPVHEIGIQLWNAFIEGTLDLRSCKCVSRVALTKCFVDGEIMMQDAELDVLLLSGSRVAGFHANRATISGAMWLDEYFISDSEVELYGIEIGGRLDCSYGYFEKGLTAPGAVIGGDLKLSGVSANAGVSFANANIGGSVFIDDAKLVSDQLNKFVLDFSRAEIKGNLTLSGTAIGAACWSEATDGHALNAENVTVHGSVTFGGRFAAKGEVRFNGADVSKSLDFSDASFFNQAGYAIRAERSKVAGAFKFNRFESHGSVSLTASQCGEMNCEGGCFRNPGGMSLDCGMMNVAGSAILGKSAGTPFKAFGAVRFSGARIGQDLICNGGRLEHPEVANSPYTCALDCGAVNISGSVSLCSEGGTPFAVTGIVSFNTSQIGQHFDLSGAMLQNPGKTALDCQGAKIAGAVFLGVNENDAARLPFSADGCVTFIGASVGLQFICQSGQFQNTKKSPTNEAYADYALNLSSIRVADAIFLGFGKRKPGPAEPSARPPTIKGSINLAGATVRVLIDDGLVSAGKDADREFGLWQTVTAPDGTVCRCNLTLDQFTYDRMNGDDVCKSALRALWLGRQPPEDLGEEFKPQPFEQLITVMRAMGYDGEADDIALFKRQSERRSKLLKTSPECLQPFWNGFVKGWGKAWAWLAEQLKNIFTILVLSTIVDLIVSGRFWLTVAVTLAVMFWRNKAFPAKLGEILFLDWFTGYGYQLGRAVLLLLVLVFGFGAFYASAFQQGAIVPADKDVRDAPVAKDFIEPAPKCRVWSVAKCPGIADQAIPLFNPWLYSADVMVPVVTFGQKAAWAPVPDVGIKLPVVGQLAAPSNFVYDVQLVETVLGWVEGFLLVSFVTGLIAKE